MDRFCRLLILLLCTVLITGCEPAPEAGTVEETVTEQAVTATKSDAVAFVAEAEKELAGLGQASERMTWVLRNFITEDTELLAAKFAEELTAAQVEFAARAANFIHVEGLDYDTHRKLNMLRSGIPVPAPRDAAKTAEQAEIGAKLSGLFGKGSYCREDGECLALGELEEIMAHSRKQEELLEIWEGWRTASVPMKELYIRQVELANQGAEELGFADLGTMWRSGYDMDPAEFPGELDRIWGQVRPLYEALHCHVRARLGEHYGFDTVPQGGPIPAHLLGNMWAQNWENIYDIVGPQETGCGF